LGADRTGGSQHADGFHWRIENGGGQSPIEACIPGSDLF
jgi:hypothetical protein